jgi:DNA modification methylase
MEYKLILGDCLIKLKDIEDNSVDSIVTDPPYGLSFMGQKWDYEVPSVSIWKECFRVLKPGGHLLSFAGSRTYHRMAVNVEDAGFEIRDQIMWLYGSGFPKSLNVGKAIDKKLGCERDKKQYKPRPDSCGTIAGSGESRPYLKKAREVGYLETYGDDPISEEAKQWDGWGTALKPAHEPICLARKPLHKKTIVENVLEYKTGAINIDGCKVGERWPANFLHDGLEEEWSKYFYCPKANKKDRNEGCENLEAKEIAGKGNGLARSCETCGANTMDGCDCEDRTFSNPKRTNHHPTVKPTELMRYLVRLVTPKDGTVLDPFMGSGSTGKACILENKGFIGIELSEDYINIAKSRIENAITFIE